MEANVGAALEAREALAAKVERELGPFAPLHLAALRVVPRERFVRPEDIDRSAEDRPLPLDESGLATISAPHAYLLSFRLLRLGPGDRLLELGTGTGYGAALAAFIVGEHGHVTSVEIDEALARRAKALLQGLPQVTVRHADAAMAAPLIAEARKVVCTFAVATVPNEWLAALGEGATLVVPVGSLGSDQRLLRVERRNGALVTTDHGGVRYVPDRSPRHS
jgi:protein-L-isoaspartate(D-aspartate) O-methyltransferase